MSLRYQIVFTVDILHDYYSSGICPDFEVLPSPDTASFLRAHGMLCKFTGSRLTVLIRVGADEKPHSPLSISARMKFYLKLNNSHFNNFTNLTYQPFTSHRYYFSNVHQTKTGSTLYLTSKILPYSSSSDYSVGSFAANASGEVFEAIKSSGGGNVHGLGQQAYWLNRDKVQYVSETDLLEFSPYVYLFNTTPATTFAIDVFGFNPSGGAYDLQVMDTANLSFTAAQTTIPVRLETLPSGQYRVKVNSESKFIYLDGEAVYRNIFGMIEVFNHLPGSNAFALFNAQGKAKATAFTLRLANRSVIWKYLARSNDITSVEDVAPLSPLSFISQGGNQFVSTRPIPLSEKPVTTLLLKSTALGDISPVANPGNSRIGTIVKDGTTYLCSEIYLNY